MKPKPKSPSSAFPTHFTITQVLILVLAGLLSLSALGLAAFQLLTPPALTPTSPAAPSQPPTVINGEQALAPPLFTPTMAPNPTPLANPLAVDAQTPTLSSPGDCVPGNTEIQLGIVTAVLSGDTIEVQVEGEKQIIGYAGVAIPGSLPGDRTFQKNMEWTAGQQVVLVKGVEVKDEPERLMRYVFIEDQFINYDFVRQGYAVADHLGDPACAAVLEQAEQNARTEHLMLWQPTRIPTLTFVPTVVLDNRLNAPCDCAIRWTCSDFQTHESAQACFNACNDYSSKLDEDHDGLACENLP